MDLKAEIEKMIDDCIKDGILSKFISERREEVIDMAIMEILDENIPLIKEMIKNKEISLDDIND